MFPELSGDMLKQRKAGLAGRSLPQRKEQLNSSIHRVYVSPRLVRQVGFNTNSILFDALISGREFYHWAKKSAKISNKALKRYVFGIFAISISTLQLVPASTLEPIDTNYTQERNVEYVIEDQVKASPAPVFQRPVDGSLSQGFWFIHPAIDIPRSYGTDINPIAEGKVTLAGWDGGYGYSVIIKHTAGFTSRYAHLSKINVKDGQIVTKETTIGLVGATGYATGSHLHLEVYSDGKNVDPQAYLPIH